MASLDLNWHGVLAICNLMLYNLGFFQSVTNLKKLRWRTQNSWGQTWTAANVRDLISRWKRQLRKLDGHVTALGPSVPASNLYKGIDLCTKHVGYTHSDPHISDP